MAHDKKGCCCTEQKDPKECTPEQIAKCHPEGVHTCCGEKAEKKHATAAK